MPETCRIIKNEAMAVRTVTKSMEMYAKKFRGQNVCFFLGMLRFLQARGFAGSVPRRGVFSREKAGPYFYVCKTMKKRLRIYSTKLKNEEQKVPGPECLCFRGNPWNVGGHPHSPP